MTLKMKIEQLFCTQFSPPFFFCLALSRYLPAWMKNGLLSRKYSFILNSFLSNLLTLKMANFKFSESKNFHTVESYFCDVVAGNLLISLFIAANSSESQCEDQQHRSSKAFLKIVKII